MLSDIEIAQKAEMKPIVEIGEKVGIAPENLENYGPYKAKLSLKFTNEVLSKPQGKLILVTAISPTPAGEGKTTTTVGLGQALSKLGKKTMICLREPSLGPCMGIKGGAAGGGYSQVVPMEDINLHFTGDFHAIGAAISPETFMQSQLRITFWQLWSTITSSREMNSTLIPDALYGIASWI